jgi:hypothetical protein
MKPPMILYVNGDSFCGDGPEQIEHGKTFGELLAKKYNLDIEEDWKGGSSNHRIYRTTVNYIMSNQSKLQDTLFLIGWTKPTRFEIYDSVNKLYIQKGHIDFYHKINEFWKEYIKLFVDVKQMKEEYIQMIFSLQSILQNYNCNYLFYNSFNDSVISETDTETVELDHINLRRYNSIVSNAIDFKRWIRPKSSFDWYINSFKREDVRMEKGQDDHPNELGHEKWFEVIDLVIQQWGIL